MVESYFRVGTTCMWWKIASCCFRILATFTCPSYLLCDSFGFDALWNSLHTIEFFVQMNVVMPTAMSSMHTDPELSANAARTARRGIRVLKYLQDKNESVKTNCDAIRAVAAGDDAENCDEERVEVSRVMRQGRWFRCGGESWHLRAQGNLSATTLCSLSLSLSLSLRPP